MAGFGIAGGEEQGAGEGSIWEGGPPALGPERRCVLLAEPLLARHASGRETGREAGLCLRLQIIARNGSRQRLKRKSLPSPERCLKGRNLRLVSVKEKERNPGDRNAELLEDQRDRGLSSLSHTGVTFLTVYGLMCSCLGKGDGGLASSTVGEHRSCAP